MDKEQLDKLLNPNLKKLDFDNFEEPLKQFAFKLIELLSNNSPERVSEHLELAFKAPIHFYDDMHFQVPTINSLLIYGVEGIQALKQYVLNDVSGVDGFRVLLGVATDENILTFGTTIFLNTYLDDDTYRQIMKCIIENTEKPEVIGAAKSALIEIYNELGNDDESRQKAVNLTTITTTISQKSKSKRLAFELLVKGRLNVNNKILSEFASMIDQGLDEKTYQKFLENFPALLDPLASSVVNTQPLGEVWKTDFVIRRLDDNYIFVEIEKPSDILFTSYPQPTSALSHALAQVINWFIWVEDNIAYAQSHGYAGIHSPSGIIVIGRKSSLNPSQIRMLKALNDMFRPRVQILTYDDVLHNAQNVLDNMIKK